MSGAPHPDERLASPEAPVPTQAPGMVKRLVVLSAAVVMFVCLGTNHAWSVFAVALARAYHLGDAQTQLVFTTGTFTFCVSMLLMGRLHDRIGPRPMAVAAAVLMATGYALAWRLGGSYPWLWASIGVIMNLGVAAGYVCPLATAVKWFPHHKGLVAGIAVGGFGLGPTVLSAIAEGLMARGWGVLDVFGLVGATYAPVILLTGMLLMTPPAAAVSGVGRTEGFGLRRLMGDRRFWVLAVAMFCGAYPYLTVMGNVKALGAALGIGELALLGVAVMSIGNTIGRIFWGLMLDRVGQRLAVMSMQVLMLAGVTGVVALGGHAIVFLAAACVIGFCYGGTLSVIPASVAGLYGSQRLGTIYSIVMVAQGLSSFGASWSGMLHDRTGSYFPGLIISLGVAAAGLGLSMLLSRKNATAAELTEGRRL